MSTLVYINDELLDLYPSTQVALSVKYLDLFDLTKRYTNYTNAFKVPATTNNNRLLGYLVSVKSLGNANNARVKVVQNGVELFSNYRCVVKNFDGSYNITCFSVEVDVFDKLAQVTIRNAEYNDTNDTPPTVEAYTNAILTANKNLVPGAKYMTPVIDYGQLRAQVITIDNFDWSDAETLRSWDQLGSDFNIPFDTAGIVTLNGTALSSRTLSQKGLAFRDGNRYTITLRYNITAFAGVTNQTASIKLYNTITGSSLTFASQVDTTSGTKTLTATALLTADYDTVSIIFNTTGTGSVTTDLTDIVATSPVSTVDIRIGAYLPVMGWTDLVGAVFRKANMFTSVKAFNSGDTTDRNLSRLVLNPAWDEFIYPENWVLSKTDKVAKNSTQTINFVAAPSSTVVTWPVDVYHGDELTSQVFPWWEGTTADSWEPNNGGGSLKTYSKARLKITISSITGGCIIRARITISGTGGVSDIETFSANGTYEVELNIDNHTLGSGAHLVQVIIDNNAGVGSATVDVLSGIFENTVGNLPYGNINWNALLPDIDGKTFVKDYMIRTCSLVRAVSDQEIVMSTIDEIVASPHNILDWTLKRDASKKDLITFNTDLAQRNIFRDSNDYTADNFEGSIDIDNDNLNPEKVIYESFFTAPTEVLTEASLRVPSIPAYNDESTGISKAENLKMCLMRLRNANTSSDGTIKYADVSTSSYKVAVYGDPLQSARSDWSYFLTNFYRTYSSIMRNFKAVTRYYNLTEDDIAKLVSPVRGTTDYHETAFMKVLDNGEMFLIDTVDHFLPGQLTKVTLIKIQ